MLLNPLLWVHDHFIVQPLRALYFRGPTFQGWGFWGGARMDTICAALLPGSHAMFWLEHMGECEELVAQRFDAFQLSIQMFIYFFLLTRLIQAMLYHWLVVHPVLQRLERLVPRSHALPTACSVMPTSDVRTTGESSTHVARDPSSCSKRRHTAPKTKY